MTYDLFDSAKDAATGNVPGWSHWENIKKHVKNDDLSSLAADIADVGATGVLAWLDPLGALVGAGVGFLIDWIKPLNDMLTWVTGDKDAIDDQRDAWGEVGKSIQRLAADMGKTLESDLLGWEGPASATAKRKIGEFIEGTRATAGEVDHIRALLSLTASLMDIAMSTIKDLISQFVEWLIVTWLAAQAAAVPTLGASEAAAAAATTGEAAVAISRGARIVQKVMKILRKMQEVLAKVSKSLGDLRDKSFWKLTGKGGNRALGPGGMGRELVEDGLAARRALGGRNGRTLPFEYGPRDPLIGGGIKLAGGVGQSEEDDRDSRVPSGREINALLNPSD
ncbi:hypothetical protein [Actinomadura parmotrematis]|uniref:WXG100 family type VII secretion target n=1 Tax=Actinomadura parmotrematis TaxID=2864039 RepID=A0ABS7FV30_9ACTN|nr:hypothetical protein [Actinomadura parmotrematis]MBW8484151.1 hypothetical protein [Actinomadura parmotrematis]